MSEVRKIITLPLLKSMFSHTGPDVMKEIIRAYSLPFDKAILRLELRRIEVLVNNDYSLKKVQEAASIWNHFKDALINMSEVERKMLRKQCKKDLLEG